MGVSTSANPELVVIGAGPYGLSIAAHLRQRGVAFRIFGIPMQNWRSAMPKGMLLKSEGFASNLSDPAGAVTLAQHCKIAGFPYGERGLPTSLETFVDYGLAFQRTLVPDVEERTVVELREERGTFELGLDNGESLTTGRVVVAVGTSYFAHVPQAFENLPSRLISHTSQHADLARFADQEVIVIGAGQSALETAALLHEQGASVRVLVRADSVLWNAAPYATPGFLGRLSKPETGLGRGWKNWFYCHRQDVFSHFPLEYRAKIVKRVLGPAGACWLKERVEGKFPVLCGHTVQAAREASGRACLTVASDNGPMKEFLADHVIAATGYKVNIPALPFLDNSLRQRLRLEGTAPVLSASFESSIPGLHFTGLASANRFGPSMRFVVGADYTARRIAGSIRPGRASLIPARRSECLSTK
jgi:FAD-dependent urate hydroxylase